MDQSTKLELIRFTNHVNKEITLMREFMRVFGRKPVDYVEFDKWVLKCTLHGSKSF